MCDIRPRARLPPAESPPIKIWRRGLAAVWSRRLHRSGPVAYIFGLLALSLHKPKETLSALLELQRILALRRASVTKDRNCHSLRFRQVCGKLQKPFQVCRRDCVHVATTVEIKEDLLCGFVANPVNLHPAGQDVGIRLEILVTGEVEIDGIGWR